MVRRAFYSYIKRSFGIGILICLFLLLLVAPALCANIIIDHTNWDWYNNQSQHVVDRVAPLKIFFAHASVGGNIMGGLSNLHTASPLRYPLIQSSTGDTPPGTTSGGTIYDFARGNPGWSLKVSGFEDYIDNGWHATAVDVVMNKFCYIDQDADWTTYRDSMLALEAEYPATKFIYWTMPITTSSYSDEVLRAQFNNNLRNWIATQNNKILFDIADIEAWSPSGVHQTFTYEEQIFEHMYADYTSDGGHLNAAGSERVAIGLYSLFGQVTWGGVALYANFTNSGIWKWDGSAWTQLTPYDPQMLTASGSNLYAAFTGYGISQWDGSTWTQLTPYDPQMMTASGSNLYAAYTGYGISQWDGSTWTQLTPYDPQMLTASGSNLYAAYTGYGISQWDGSTWTQLTPYYPQILTASGSNLYAAFTGYGISQWDGSTWTQLTPYYPQMMTASGSNLYAAFTGYGISQWDGSTWTQLTPYYPQMMTASGSNLYAAFTGYGISQWDGSTWTQLTPYEPASMVIGY